MIDTPEQVIANRSVVVLPFNSTRECANWTTTIGRANAMVWRAASLCEKGLSDRRAYGAQFQCSTVLSGPVRSARCDQLHRPSHALSYEFGKIALRGCRTCVGKVRVFPVGQSADKSLGSGIEQRC